MADINEHYCQHCGNNRKWVETLIDDEFLVDENGEVDPIGYSDDFEHTGKEICTKCEKEWSGKVK